jgi:steroid 5-alpha reductase family enzyme
MIIMVAMWALSLALKNSSIIDPFWGTGFVVLAWLYFFLTDDGSATRKLLITGLVTVWGLRLSLYLLWRNWGKGEDFRYVKWREAAGAAWWWRSFFKVFFLQGLIMWGISTPLLAAQYYSTFDDLLLLDVLAAMVWTIGFFFEAIGDWQLSNFKNNPDNKGKVLNTGVWSYTRHPNYFGDATQWWGYYLIALSAGGFWTIYAPVIMTLLLMKVSGVVLLEKTLVQTKPHYREYIETTSAFFPRLPRTPKTPPAV